jgi:hypothetical protein
VHGLATDHEVLVAVKFLATRSAETGYWRSNSEAAVQDGGRSRTSAEIISEALRSLATDKITEEELKSAKKRIRALEEALHAARSTATEKEKGAG